MRKVRKNVAVKIIGVFAWLLCILISAPFLFARTSTLWKNPDPDSAVQPCEAPDTAWTRTYGGPYVDRGYSIQQTIDGGYIVTGVCGTAVDPEIVFLSKTDDEGFLVWTNTYSGDKGYSVVQTSDMGYIVTGHKSAGVGDSSGVYLLKVDDFGTLSWTKIYDETGENAGYSIFQTSDGGYIITGVQDGDICLLKTDASGDSTWAKYYGGAYDDCGYSVNQTSDEGYIITGTIKNSDTGSDTGDVYLIKTDSLGDSLWTKIYGGRRNDGGYAVQQTSDGGYIITGYTASFSADSTYDLYLIKTKANGDSIWTMTYGIDEYHDCGYSVYQTGDGGYIVCGSTTETDSIDDPLDVYLIKTDALGNRMWSKAVGGKYIDCGHSVYITSDGGYIIAGYTRVSGVDRDDVYLVKIKPMLSITRPNGREQWQGGSIQTIKWHPENIPSSSYHYRLFFSSDSGHTFPDTIADNLDVTTQSYEWTVPLIDCASCRIKLELVDAEGTIIASDVSLLLFIIDMTTPAIESTTVWTDTTYSGPFDIRTQATDNLTDVDSVYLYYNRDGDSDWITSIMNQIDSSAWYADSIPPVAQCGDSVRYYIEAKDGAGNRTTDPPGAPTAYYAFMVSTTGVVEHDEIATSFSFRVQNNPVCGRAVFTLTMPTDGYVTLKMYDITGRLIATPVSHLESAGYHEICWGDAVNAGVYFYILKSPWYEQTGKLVLVR
jgi:hypothetical protein